MLDTKTATAAMTPHRSEVRVPLRVQQHLRPAYSIATWIRRSRGTPANSLAALPAECQTSPQLCSFRVVLIPFLRRQGWQDQFVGQQGALHQSRKHPAQRGDVVSLVRGTCGKLSRCLRNLAANTAMSTMQMAGCFQRLIQRSEHHGEHHAEGLMEAADGIVQRSRVFGNRCCDPGMRELQQRRASRRQEKRRLAIDLPTDRTRPEESGQDPPADRLTSLSRRSRSVVETMQLGRPTCLMLSLRRLQRQGTDGGT